ncbi:MAG: efflux RND transporter periplasmic adaptor subunit, partial [Dehalobacterium sp.]
SVDIGSVVKKGDPIIKLDAKDLEAQVVQAQAGVNTAQANLAKIQKGARHEQISQAQAALASARITYENAQNSYERNMQLFNEGALSQSQLEQSQTAYAAAEAAYQSAQEALDILNKGETPESIRVMQTQLEQAEAALELTRTQLNNAVVVSPISGIVIAKNINPGEMAAPGISLITVVNLDSLIINAYLPEVHLSKIKDGQEVVVRVAEVPDREFRGEITLIGSVIDPKNKNILVRVKFKDKDYDPSIKPGMFAEIALDY